LRPNGHRLCRACDCVVALGVAEPEYLQLKT
jgi:hypothetical protein